MLNECELGAVIGLEALDRPTSIEEILPTHVVAEIEKFKAGEIDNLIIHGFPIPHDLPATPSEIRDQYDGQFPAYILKSVGEYLGTISPKGVENTIRFRTGNLGIVNEETWHGHYQYQYTLFYCLRGDPAAQTHFFSANALMKNVPADIAEILLTSYKYFPDRESFPLITKSEHGYSISHHIYDRSDFEKYVKDLDLPDVLKALEKMRGRAEKGDAEQAVEYLLDTIKDSTPAISYKPGDVALYDERSTIRFSPSYTPTTPQAEDRWILALTVEAA